MGTPQEFDIIVAGTGPAGLIAALALADAGFSICLAGPPVRRDDSRTTALMIPSLEFLDKMQLGDTLREAGAPLRIMRIVDMTNRLVRSPAVTFRASEIGQEAFGHNIPNRVLGAALEKALGTRANIHRAVAQVVAWEPGAERIVARLDVGVAISARLAVAADGRGSPARGAAGIDVKRAALPQLALVVNFSHQRGHDDTSTEFHTADGPFTQVPLRGENRSSLVWVTSPQKADELAAMDDPSLSRAVETMMQSMLGKVSVEPGRQVYPLSTAMPARFADRRIALVGEAAHVFPPIGAQGLNLSIRDVRDVVDTVRGAVGDPGADTVLARYDAKRRPDVMARAGAVNALNRSLLSDLLPAQLLRCAGLGLLGASAPLRSIFMREGMRPGSGLGAAGTALREKVRR